MLFKSKLLHLFESRITDRRDLPAGSLPEWQQWLTLGQAEARSWELYPGLPYWWQGPKTTGSFSVAFPETSAGSWGARKVPGTQI